MFKLPDVYVKRHFFTSDLKGNSIRLIWLDNIITDVKRCCGPKLRKK